MFDTYTIMKRALGIATAGLLLVATAAAAAATCRCLPGQECWPSEDEWRALNATVDGALVKVTPIGAVCHDPTYDQDACEDLQARWNDVKTQ